MTLVRTVVVSGSASAPSRTLTLAQNILAAVAAQVAIEPHVVDIAEIGSDLGRALGRSQLAVASARIGRHFQSVQRAFDDLYRFFDVVFVIPPVFVLDEQVQLGEQGLSLDPSAEAAIERAATALLSALFTPERASATL